MIYFNSLVGSETHIVIISSFLKGAVLYRVSTTSFILNIDKEKDQSCQQSYTHDYAEGRTTVVFMRERIIHHHRS